MDYEEGWAEIKAIDDTKAGVKGLVDAGVVEIPRIFVRPPHELAEELNMCKSSTLQVPVVDLSGVEVEDGHKKIVDEIREASEKWGFFQLINHGIPSSVLEGMIDGTRKFHEQDVEVKKEYYSSDPTREVRYDSNLHVYKTKGTSVSWKDTLFISAVVSKPEEIPRVCRKTSLEYINHVTKLADILLGLLSEALGLKPDHLKAAECDKGQVLACHYYPTCPQPELTLGTAKHTDPSFLTIVLQDQSGGLQVMCDNQLADVTPIQHGLIVNIGDLLQILSNDKFVSANHRVVANKIGPRISVACFFNGLLAPSKMYGPIKELISEENPPLYEDFQVVDYVTKFFSKPLDKTGLDLLRL
ncbi:1-aminocyclopropane-1-carboxylate oxidase homolog 1-like [Solanum tuberosum]|uniref:1-aminocyclopropane-1-carboxylate oxidase homolog 1-like n=1 Tax=Solanum tuberosum TaxID=4113 RepID=UPI0003D26F25|nr:PREDICTED: 1-aminocyclopropane-1-carboxylate oxidase homolog 1-like [Solanum tuberosum]